MSDPSTPPAGVPTCYRHPGRETHIRCQRCDRPICPDCMRDAAVGFQCPDCVAEGRKTTRAGRTAFGGLRPTNASATSAVLIALNAAVWFAITVTGGASIIATSGGKSAQTPRWTLMLDPTGSLSGDSLSGMPASALGEV